MKQPTTKSDSWTDPQRADALATLQRVRERQDQIRQQLAIVRCQSPQHAAELTELAKPVIARCESLLMIKKRLRKGRTPDMSPSQVRIKVAELNSLIGHWNIQVRQPRWLHLFVPVQRKSIEAAQQSCGPKESQDRLDHSSLDGVGITP